MSMFYCAKCDGMRDSDDGCEEYGKFGLICTDCLDNFGEINASEDTPGNWLAIADGEGVLGAGPTRGEAIKDLIESHLEPT